MKSYKICTTHTELKFKIWFGNCFWYLNSGNGPLLCTFLLEKPLFAQKIQSRPNRANKSQQRSTKASKGLKRPKQQKRIFSSIINIVQAAKGIIIPQKVLFLKSNFHKSFVTNRTLMFFHSVKFSNHISFKILKMLIDSIQISFLWVLGMLACGVQSVIFSPNFPKWKWQ